MTVSHSYLIYWLNPMTVNSLLPLSCLVAVSVAQTTDVFANDADDNAPTLNLSASAGGASSLALNLGASLTLTQKNRKLDVGLAAGKGVDGPTLSANLHAGVHTPGSRWYLLGGYRFERYADTSESFAPVFMAHLLTGRTGVFLPQTGQFRIRLEGELGIPMVSIYEESGAEDDIRFLEVESFYAGVSVALSYSFR